MSQLSSKASAIPTSSLDLCSTGVEGFDEILNGGLPRDCVYLVQGDPGSGKTTLALQFLLQGVKNGESVFYITLSETSRELRKVAESHGWNLDSVPLIELSAVESMLRPEAQTTVFRSSEMEMTSLSRMIMEAVGKIKPSRIVFDSLSEFRLIADSPLRYRRQLLALKQEFSKYRSTVLLLDDKMGNFDSGSDPHVLSLTHGVLDMEQRSPDYGISRRRLRLRKLRGVKFREGYHDYDIYTGGMRIFPRLTVAEHHAEFDHEEVSSGIKELDALFGGGLDRGTSSFIIGPAGTGKSTLALHYAAEMGRRGEKSIIFVFDEVRGVMLRRGESLGLELKRLIDDGTVIIQQIDPAELSPGEFAVRIRNHVEKGCKLVVIDSLNGYLNSMPGEKYLINQLHELCSYLNQQGVVTILILAQQGLMAAAEAPVDLSYLADTVVNLRYFEAYGEVKQAITVIKKRTGPHERAIREFKLEAGKGIRIGEPIREFHGVLTGIPDFQGTPQQILKSSDAES
ncbi:MAG: ATPase domain-containing protein [Verrucomicrobiota bacterium]|nr:ATPase domain-containing protein [Verrucomicrobiota bacterium]